MTFSGPALITDCMNCFCWNARCHTRFIVREALAVCTWAGRFLSQVQLKSDEQASCSQNTLPMAKILPPEGRRAEAWPVKPCRVPKSLAIFDGWQGFTSLICHCLMIQRRSASSAETKNLGLSPSALLELLGPEQFWVGLAAFFSSPFGYVADFFACAARGE